MRILKNVNLSVIYKPLAESYVLCIQLLILDLFCFLKDEEKLRKEAEKDIVKPKICPVEAIDDAEVKKLYRNSISEAEKSDKSRDPSPAMSPTRAKRKPGPKSKPKSKKQAEKDVIKPKISRLEESDDEKSVKSTKSEKSGVSRDSSPVSVAASTPSAKRKPAGRTPKPKSAQATKKKPFTTNNAKVRLLN